MKETRVWSACEMKTSWSKTFFLNSCLFLTLCDTDFPFQRGSTQDHLYHPRLDYMNSATGHKVVFQNISLS